MKHIPKITLYVYIVAIMLSAVLSLNGSAAKLNDIYILEFRADYLIHAGLFIFLMFLISRTYHVSFRRDKKKALLWLVIALALAFVAEWVQHFVPSRVYNINDIIANMLGVLIGLGFFFKK